MTPGRICIAGGPRTGKTTRADALSTTIGRVRHTDDLIAKLDWSAASAAVATWFDEPGPWVIEGVAVPRALRKWLAAHRDGTPCDAVILLTEPHVRLTDGQTRMAKGVATVWAEIVGELASRGARVM